MEVVVVVVQTQLKTSTDYCRVTELRAPTGPTDGTSKNFKKFEKMTKFDF